MTVRRATRQDAADAGRLLHDFHREFDEPTPEPAVLGERLGRLIETDETIVLLAGDGPDGLAVLRLRPALYGDALEAYVAELYVRPARRGAGLGRALMEAAMKTAREAGADRMDLGTSEDDTTARALYESLGFTNREGGDEGPVMLFYEREL